MTQSRTPPELVLTSLLVICAVILTVLVIRREIFTSPDHPTQLEPEY